VRRLPILSVSGLPPSPMDAVFLGRVGYDLISEEPHVALKDVRRFSRYLGGSSANQAVGLARLGKHVGMVSAVSSDAFGDFLVEFLQREGVETRSVHRLDGYLTSLSITEVSPPDNFPQIFYRKDPVDVQLRVSEADLAYIERARLFATNGTSLCGSPSRESALTAMERAHRAGATVVFDVDYRAMSWPEIQEAGAMARSALPHVDVLIGNEIEVCLVAGVGDAREAVEMLRERVPTVVCKLGAAGVRMVNAQEDHTLAPVTVEVVSTIGAGDGFAAGFLYALSEGKPPLDCLRYGNTAAAIVVSRLSCSEAMPTLAEVEALL
jgi:5-dehydro-2-deoxygluconokinase